MRENPSERTAQIGRMCRWLRIATWIFIIGVWAIYLMAWCMPLLIQSHVPHFPHIHLAGLPAGAVGQLAVGDRLLLASISLPYLGILSYAFLRLNRMLHAFERGEFFEHQTVGHLRMFAGALFTAKVLALLAMHARVHAYAYLMGNTRSHGAINLSSDDLAVLLMCALFFLVARLMEEGRRLTEENREFI